MNFTEKLELTAEDRAFWELLAVRLSESDHPALCPSADTAALMETLYPAQELRPALVTDLVGQLGEGISA